MSNNVENQIRIIWKELLDIEYIGLQDSFFNLGGDELLFTALKQIVARQFNISYEGAEKGNFSTLYQQIQFIKKKLNYMDESIIVTLRDGEENVPLVFVHPIGGTLFSFLKLCKSINSNNVILGIQDAFLYGDMRHYNSVAEQAKYYAEALLETYDIKELILFGYSSGGIVACEMINILRARGVKVKHLVMFDSWAKMPFGLPFRNKFKSIILRQFDTIKPYQFFSTQEEIDNWLDTLWNRLRLILTYQPYEQPIEATLFVPKEAVPEYVVDESAYTLWKTLFTSCTIHYVEGNHENMLDMSDISPIAKIINTLLSQVTK